MDEIEINRLRAALNRIQEVLIPDDNARHVETVGRAREISLMALNSAPDSAQPVCPANMLPCPFAAFSTLPSTVRGGYMSLIKEQVDHAMLEVNGLSNLAKALGDLPIMYAANRAWGELLEARKAMSPADGGKP